jgi:hypothetical protein
MTSLRKLNIMNKAFWHTRDANTTAAPKSSTLGENLVAKLSIGETRENKLSEMTGWRDADEGDNPGPAQSRATVYSPPPSAGRVPNGFEPSYFGGGRLPPEGGQFRLANAPDWQRIVGGDVNAFHREWHKAGAGPVRDSLEAYWQRVTR